MKRNPDLCEFAFCPYLFTVTVRATHPRSEFRPLHLCDKHAAQYSSGFWNSKTDNHKPIPVVVTRRLAA
jgi:hypothetical protein